MASMETYHGHVRTPADAIILFEACRLGSLPRVQRRLSEKERQSIKSGSVFVWDEREAGMRRWTDGKSWSASRVSGSFLTYREMEGKRGGNSYASSASRAGKTPESTRGSDSDFEQGGEEGPDGYRYKPDGLMKQSFSITTTAGNHLHLISYYSRSHPATVALPQPSTDPNLRHIRPAQGMYPESTIHDAQSVPGVGRAPGPMARQMSQMAGYPRNGGHQAPVYVQAGYGQWPSPSYAQHQLPPPLPPAYAHAQYSPALPPLANAASPAHRRNASNGAAYCPPFQPSPRTGHLTPQHSSHNSPASTPPMSNLDPRLMAPSSLAQQHHQSLHPLEAHRRSPSPRRSAEKTNGAASIPGIGALMNGADAYERSRSRSSSRSPGGGPIKREGPQDIPHEKLGFGEDMRALRVLDRAFKT